MSKEVRRKRNVMRGSVNVALICLLSVAAGTIAAGGYYGRPLATEDVETVLQAIIGPPALLQRQKIGSQDEKVNATATTSTCDRDWQIVLDAAYRLELWALKILDASSKIPLGILEGNIFDMGMYDECLSSRGKSMGVEIQGRHCMFSIVPNIANDSLPLYPTLSLCLPATCDAADLINLLNFTVDRLAEFINRSLAIEYVHCSPLKPVVIWDTEFTLCFSILMIFIGFLIICSVCHCYKRRHSSTLQVLSCFSLQRNAAAIVSTDIKEGHLPVIHGIRFLSMAWVVLCHQYIMAAFAPNVNTLYILEWIQSWRSMPIFAAQFAVDTFFTLNGFLMTYLFMKRMQKHRRFNIPMYYLRRFVRLTLPVIALIVFSVVFLPKIGSGARWRTITDLFFGGCRSKWWPTLLYTQNFVDKDNLCLVHLWYLAVDMQLFWISPVILYPLYARPKMGMAILFSLMIASLVVPAAIVGVKKYPAESFVHKLNITVTKKVFQDFYEMPYNRAGPWLIGILLGYELSNNKRTLSKINLTIGWLLAVGSFAFCIFGLRSFMAPHYKYNPVWETFFTVVSRPTWAVGICWIIFASVYEYAGPVSKLLNCKYFHPLSRLSYCIYLVHFVFQLVDVAALRTSIYFSDYNVWQAYLSKLIGSIGIAFILSLLFESPVQVLEKMILRKRNHQKSQYESLGVLQVPEEEEILTGER